MSADSRTVATDALATLGTIIDANQKRDAIHLAVIPMQAGMKLYPGANVGVIDGKAYREGAKLVGIVDPFITNERTYPIVEKDQWFWLVIYPRVITSLRHVWSHPDFSDEEEKKDFKFIDKDASEAWLIEFCKNADCPPWNIVRQAIEGTLVSMQGEYDYGTPFTYDNEFLHFNGLDAHSVIPPMFWDHVEVVLGRKPPHKPGYFSCSC